MPTGARSAARGSDRGTSRGSLYMPTRSQPARGVGNRDASLSFAGDRTLVGEHDSAGLGASSGTAGRPRTGSVSEPARCTRWSNIGGPDHTRSRCSTACHKGRRGNGGSLVVARDWPLWAWTSPPKLGILKLLGERSPGPLAGGGETAVTPFYRHLPRVISLHSLSFENWSIARARARR